MKNQYLRQISQWWLMVVWLAGVSLNARAQSTPPPVIQWQRVIDGGDVTATSTFRAATASNGGYAVLAGKNLIRLSVAGDVVWNKTLSGAYQDSTASYAPIREALALAATPDGGFVALGRDVLNRYYVTKLDSAGVRTWTRTLDNANVGPRARLADDVLMTAPDGSLFVVGAYNDVRAYLTLTKLNQEGVIAGKWRISYPGPQSTTLTVRKALNTFDGGYLLVGKAADNTTTGSRGLAIKLNAQYNVIWQRTYTEVDSLNDVVANPLAAGVYTAAGSGGGISRLLTVAPAGPGDGSQVAALVVANAPASLAADRAGNLTLLDGTSANAGDFRLVSLSAQLVERWRKTVGGSGNDRPATLLATDDGGFLLVGTTTSTNGDVVGKSANTIATWIVKLSDSPTVTTLLPLTPTYNCQTGVIVFNTTGGDGSPITYSATGVRQTTPTDNFGTVESELRNDPKVITIQATQRGQTVSYAFDFGAYCRVSAPAATTTAANALRLIAPTYNCETGAITFRATGGDGSPIEYAALGITGWTTNPNQFVDRELRMASDVQPFTLMARQNGRVVMYVFNAKAACGRARVAVTEPTAGLTVRALGNPVHELATVEIGGGAGSSLVLDLTDARGRLVEHRIIEQAGATERQTFDLRRQPVGTLLLRTTANGQTRMLKVIKQ